MSTLKLFIIAFVAQVLALLAIEFCFESYGWGIWFEKLAELFNLI